MARRRTPSPGSRRAELLRRLHLAGREGSTATIMFHTTLAALQGLSPTETKALDVLDREGALTAGELAARTGLAPPSVTGLVARLERKGLARRSPDPADRRRVRIDRAPDAIARLAPHFAAFGAALDSLYAEFTDDELETILRFMTEVARRQRDATARLTAARTPPG